MNTPSPDTPIATPQRSDHAPRRRERRRPVTTQESREYALHDALLTEQGFQQGYVVLKPGRWLWRCWLEFERFNDALQRVETQTFTLLSNRQTDFLPHIQALQAVLEDYRATLRRLTHHANTLASGRVKELEPLTQQAVGAWQDDPSPLVRGDDPPPAAGPLDAPSVETPAGAETPPPVPDLTTLFGPSLAEERAAAQAGEPS